MEDIRSENWTKFTISNAIFSRSWVTKASCWSVQESSRRTRRKLLIYAWYEGENVSNLLFHFNFQPSRIPRLVNKPSSLWTTSQGFSTNTFALISTISGLVVKFHQTLSTLWAFWWRRRQSKSTNELPFSLLDVSYAVFCLLNTQWLVIAPKGCLFHIKFSCNFQKSFLDYFPYFLLCWCWLSKISLRGGGEEDVSGQTTLPVRLFLSSPSRFYFDSIFTKWIKDSLDLIPPECVRCHTKLWSWHSSQSRAVSPLNIPICRSSFPQDVFTNLLLSASQLNHLFCISHPSNWNSTKQTKMSKKINNLGSQSFSEDLQNFFFLFCVLSDISHVGTIWSSADRRHFLLLPVCRYREILYCKRNINFRLRRFFFKPPEQKGRKKKGFSPIN